MTTTAPSDAAAVADMLLALRKYPHNVAQRIGSPDDKTITHPRFRLYACNDLGTGVLGVTYAWRRTFLTDGAVYMQWAIDAEEAALIAGRRLRDAFPTYLTDKTISVLAYRRLVTNRHGPSLYLDPALAATERLGFVNRRIRNAQATLEAARLELEAADHAQANASAR